MKTTRKPTATPDPEVGVKRDGLWCESCQHEVPEDELIPLYECTNDNDVSSERRCESCKRFKSRADTDGCHECEEPVKDAELTTDYDGETILFEDFVEGGVSAAARKAESDAIAAAERAKKAVADKAERLANSDQDTWASAKVGDVLLKFEPASWESPYRTIAYLAETPDGRIVAGLYDHSYRTQLFDKSDPLTRSTDAAVITEATKDAARKPMVTLTRLPDGPLENSSSPTRGLRIEVGHAARDGGLLPVMEIHTTGSNICNRVATFHDAALATTYLDTLEKAALDYAAITGPVTDPDSAELEVDLDAGWVSSEFYDSGTVQIGTNAWTRTEGPVLNIIYSGNVVTFTDPSIVLDAIAVARTHLDKLTLAPKVVGK